MTDNDHHHEETTYSLPKQSTGCWSSVQLPSNEEAKQIDIKRLSVVTFNVWFDGFLQRERADSLFEICRNCQADVMCFQEVTTGFLGWLLALPWVREQYYVNDIEGTSWGTWYGVLVLTRFLPTKLGILADFPTNQGRRFVYVDLLLNRETFRIGTVHLESFARSTNFRMAQLDRIFPILSSPVIDHSALLGDMNLCSTWEENERGFVRRSEDQQHQDVWSVLRKDDIGFTENTDINTMRLTSPNQGHEKKVRFDRILLRSTAQKWRAVSIQLLGTTPIAPDVFPSDHFGLHSVFIYSTHWEDSHDVSLVPPAYSLGELPQACYMEDF